MDVGAAARAEAPIDSRGSAKAMSGEAAATKRVHAGGDRRCAAAVGRSSDYPT